MLGPRELGNSPGVPFASEFKNLDFENTEKVYKWRSTLELMRAVMVLKASQSKPMMKHSEAIFRGVQRVLGTRFFNALLRRSFFGHFCGGEDRQTIKPTVQALNDHNIRCILDYAAEADVVEEEKTPETHRESARVGVVAARVYDYLGEEECDRNCEVFMRCLEAAAEQERGFVAVKLTALCRPVLLQRMTTLLLTIREMWSECVVDVKDLRVMREVSAGGMASKVDRGAAHYGDMLKDLKVNREEFRAIMNHLGIALSKEEFDRLFRSLDTENTGSVDYIEWTTGLNLEDMLTVPERHEHHLVSYSEPTLAVKGLIKQLHDRGHLPLMNEEESMQYLNFVDRLNRIATAAAEKRVRILIDAEQTYVQGAIDHVARHLQLKFNGRFPLVFNTYQTYLNWSLGRVLRDIERSQRRGYYFAGKIVRGAYVVLERERAREYGYPDPIVPNKAMADANYNRCIQLCLQHHMRSNVMFATHNQESIEIAVRLMHERGISRDNGGVFFAQLLGMSDSLSFTLAQESYQVYKYVPYGRVDQVMPYLLRRAQENSDMLGSGAKECRLQ
eukprot:CAMPEP_0119157306 /NCGR_PEP_ID=MMETSP1310-20130426/52690_1 /TAXON_ID=464262 /ORGANISM="Genus nov. species nov., Strain RCC2339" /LENGTH=559 /DNA_ID=CAMNT_0007149921 /DNA_START=3 /DNA_END=1679 /DNA_ORIENTATION=+